MNGKLVSDWEVYHEHVGGVGSAHSNLSSAGPIEQLLLTDGFTSDYLWYTTPVATAGSYDISIHGGGGTIFYPFVDGVPLVANGARAIGSGRNHTRGIGRSSSGRSSSVPYSAGGRSEEPTEVEYRASSAGKGQPKPALGQAEQGRQGSSKLQVLSVAMGLSNGGVGPESRKGITGNVTVNGVNVTTQAWGHHWVMSGEAKQVFTEAGQSSVSWQPALAGNQSAPNVWLKARFDLPALSGSMASADAADSHAPVQLAHALRLTGMNKGVAYVNGFELGRYWLKPGACHGACAPPIKNGFCYMHWKDCDKPTQTGITTRL
jgi:hypothetical protein